MKIKVVGFDPSMSNFGMAQCLVDVSTLEIEVANLVLVTTRNESNKGIIKTSDDLRRAKEILVGMQDASKGQSIAISEIPLGTAADFRNGILSAGIVTGVLASCPIPLIQVSPAEVKLVATGSRSAGKDEIIEWAMTKYPNANWITRKLKGKIVPTAANEHLADAVAAVHAGVKTQQFMQAMQMYRAMAQNSP